MEIEDWLLKVGLPQYALAFSDNDIDAAILPRLTADDLRDIGVASVGHRRKLLDAIEGLRAFDPINAQSFPQADTEKAISSEAERRQLTVMFVDLVGSTALSASLDPEDASAVIHDYQNAAAGEIARVEGHVAKFMGDGVLAYFGWPRAHEDEAARAARAGLSIVAAVARLRSGDAPLACRVGVATGLVVVGDLIGTGSAREETVVGDTPNLAARLQAVASPGAVVVADATRRLLGSAFELTDLGEQTLKGFAAPVVAYAITGERPVESRFAARKSEDVKGAEVPLVGRDAEMAVMLDRWEAARHGQGQLVLLSGEAGIGKSRIAQALTETAPGVTTRVIWQCSPYHADTALHPAIQQITRSARFELNDGTLAKLDRLEALLAESGVAEGATPQLLAALLGLDAADRYGALDLSAARQRALTLEALIDWLEGLANRGPVLWMLEDAHWIDPTTLELVDLALERIAANRVLVLVTARPTFEHGFGGHPIVTRLSLNRLGREAVANVIRRITGAKPLPSALMEEVAARTDGVPLYVEEMTKAVLESDAIRETATEWILDGPLDRLAIPSSLHDSLMARLDRLQPVKDVAQTAAVIGRAFDHATLAELSPLAPDELQAAMDRLAEAELVFRRGVAPEASYIFKHALVRDAAYESLLRGRRQALHLRLVEILDATDARPELLAQHAQAAGETTRALAWWRMAGEAAIAAGAFDEAVGHLDAAETLLDALDDPEAAARTAAGIAVLRALGSLVSRGYSHPNTVALYDRAEGLARKADDALVLLTASYGVWAGHHTGEKVVPGLETSERMLAEAALRADDRLEMMGHRLRATSLTVSGRLDEALPEFEMTHTQYNPARHQALSRTTGTDHGIGMRCYQAIALLALGRVDAAQDLVREAQDISATQNSVNVRAYTLYHCGQVAATGRLADEAIALADELGALSESVGLLYWGPLAPGLSGLALLEQGRIAEALEDLTRCVESSRASGIGPLSGFWLSGRAEALARLGDDAALTAAEDAETHVRRTGGLYALAEVQRRRGVAIRMLRPNDAVGPDKAFRAAMATAKAQNAQLWELRAACDLARLMTDAGQRAEARAILSPIHAAFTEGFDGPDMRDATALLEYLA